MPFNSCLFVGCGGRPWGGVVIGIGGFFVPRAVNDDCIPVGLVTLHSLAEARKKFVVEETERERHIRLFPKFQRRKRGVALPGNREMPEPF
jgi:hypothetical protein